jgi:2-methylcitrate dehydratase PrpD
MLTEVLSRFVASSTYDALSPAAVAGAKKGMLDCLGVGLAATREDVSRIVQERVRLMTGAQEATVIGAGFKANAPLAAYANGAMAHALDYDDVIHVGPFWLGHPSVVVFPAALAVAEAAQASGRDLILAYSLGIEVYTKVGLFCGEKPYRQGWHNTSYIGVMAAAAAACSMLGLDEGQVRRAFGIAASTAGGLRQNFGSMTKPLHAGLAARNGVEAAYLAQAGLTADEAILEAPLGFRNVFTASREDVSQAIPLGDETVSPAELEGRLGAPWVLETPGLAFKICPSCRATHFGMEAALLFRETHADHAAEIVEVEAHVPTHMGSVLFHHDPQSGLEGKFSLEYVLARTLIDGPPKISDFTDERVGQPAVKALMKRIRWLPFEPPQGAFGTPQFLFRLANGETLSVRVEHPRGDPENPVSDDLLAGKFVDCATASVSTLSAERLKDLVLDLERLDRISTLSAALHEAAALT